MRTPSCRPRLSAFCVPGPMRVGRTGLVAQAERQHGDSTVLLLKETIGNFENFRDGLFFSSFSWSSGSGRRCWVRPVVGGSWVRDRTGFFAPRGAAVYGCRGIGAGRWQWYPKEAPLQVLGCQPMSLLPSPVCCPLWSPRMLRAWHSLSGLAQWLSEKYASTSAQPSCSSESYPLPGW